MNFIRTQLSKATNNYQAYLCKCVYSNKGISIFLLILFILLVLALIGAGVFFYLRHIEASHHKQLISEAQHIQQASEQYWKDKGKVFWDPAKEETESASFIAEIDSNATVIRGTTQRLPQQYIDNQGSFSLQDIADNLEKGETARFFDISISEIEEEGYLTIVNHPGYFVVLNPTGEILVANPEDEITQKRITEPITRKTGDEIEIEVPENGIPIANKEDLMVIGMEYEHVFAAGTPYETKTMIGTMEDNYFMVEDVNLGEENFFPIGYYPGEEYISFTGTFNGNGFKIYDGAIEHQEDGYIGMFAHNEGTISNLTLRNVKISGDRYVGMISGINWNGTIRDVIIEGGNITGNNYTGGIAGFNRGSIYMTETFNATITGNNNYTGGVTGNNSNGVIEASSVSSGNIRGQNHTGGLAGHQDWEGLVHTSTINETRINGNDGTGGLVGTNNKGVINGSQSNANISGRNRIGGIVGCNNGIIGSSSSEGNINSNGLHIGGVTGRNYDGAISTSFSMSEVKGGFFVGGLVGWNANNSNIELSYSRNSVSGKEYVGGLVGQNTDSNIRLAFSTAAVKGEQYTGGLVGHNNGKITESHSRGRVEGRYHTGGFIGANSNGGTIENAYSRGEVVGRNLFTGGFAGSNDGHLHYAYASGETNSRAGDVAGGFLGWNRGSSQTKSLHWYRREPEQPGVARGNREGVKSISYVELKDGKPGGDIYKGWQSPPWEFTLEHSPIFGWE